MRFAAMRSGDCRGKEIFQFEDAAAGGHVFFGGNPRYGRFVHTDRFSDGLEIKRPQVLDSASKKRVLLPPDLVSDLENGSCALIERTNEPSGILQTIGEIGLFGIASRGRRNLRVVGLVDQDLRQGVGIELDQPVAIRRSAYGHVGYDWLNDC